MCIKPSEAISVDSIREGTQTKNTRQKKERRKRTTFDEMPVEDLRIKYGTQYENSVLSMSEEEYKTLIG